MAHLHPARGRDGLVSTYFKLDPFNSSFTSFSSSLSTISCRHFFHLNLITEDPLSFCGRGLLQQLLAKKTPGRQRRGGGRGLNSLIPIRDSVPYYLLHLITSITGRNLLDLKVRIRYLYLYSSINLQVPKGGHGISSISSHSIARSITLEQLTETTSMDCRLAS